MNYTISVLMSENTLRDGSQSSEKRYLKVCLQTNSCCCCLYLYSHFIDVYAGITKANKFKEQTIINIYLTNSCIAFVHPITEETLLSWKLSQIVSFVFDQSEFSFVICSKCSKCSGRFTQEVSIVAQVAQEPLKWRELLFIYVYLSTGNTTNLHSNNRDHGG